MWFEKSLYKIRVEYIRDGLAEEWHEGFVQIGNEKNSHRPYYLRSCAKPIQAALLSDYEINFAPNEIALCCGSHAGEDCHVELANSILNKLGLNESFLKCGVHPPLSRSMQDKMLLSGINFSAIHNNCSGKHIAFLAICKKMGWDISSYNELNHPLQIAIKDKIRDLCEVKEVYPITTDGCGVPIYSMPLFNLVNGYKNLQKFYPIITDAIYKNPYIYGGENRTDTEIIQKSENLIAKVGAGGLCVVLNLKERNAFAIKINDCSYEARRIAAIEMINHLGWGNIEYEKGIYTIQKKKVGIVKTSFIECQ